MPLSWLKNVSPKYVFLKSLFHFQSHKVSGQIGWKCQKEMMVKSKESPSYSVIVNLEKF